MELKRFNTLNEAAKKETTKELEGKAEKFIKDELKKKKMSRSDIIKTITAKFDGKVARKIVDKIIEKTDGLKNDSFIGGVKSTPKKAYPYYFIGTDAKDPEGLEKQGGKKEEKEETKGKVSKFDDFKKEDEKNEPKEQVLDEEEAKKAKSTAKKDMKKDKKEKNVKGFDSFEKDNAKGEKEDKEKASKTTKDKSRRKYAFEQDSMDDLNKKLKDDNFKDEWSDIKAEIAARPKKKRRK